MNEKTKYFLLYLIVRTEAPSRIGREKCNLQRGAICLRGDRLVPLEPISALVALWHELSAPTDVGGGNNGEVYEVRNRGDIFPKELKESRMSFLSGLK